MTCYMCGSPATRRMTPDIVRLCDDVECGTSWWMISVEGEDWDWWREHLHEKKGNELTPA